MERFNLREMLAARANQRSFHVAAEEHVRVELRNMTAGHEVETFRYEGNVVLLILTGSFQLNEDPADLRELDQVVFSSGERVSLKCKREGALQIIWSPPHATTEK
jgi:hypothetical protein